MYKLVHQLGFPLDHCNKVVVDIYEQSKPLESSDNLQIGESRSSYQS